MQDATLEAEFSASAKDLVDRFGCIARARRNKDHGYEPDPAIWHELAQAGWFSILVPESDDGLGLDLAQMAAVCTQAGRELLPEPYIGTAVQIVGALVACPGSELRSDLLQRIMAGELIGSLAWQEAFGDVVVSAPNVQAQLDGQSLLVNGHKRFVVAAKDAQGYLVNASLPDGEVVLLWVTSQSPGLKQRHLQGVDGTSVSDLWFEDVQVSQEQVLARGDAAVRALECGNDFARLATAADLLGTTERAFEMTLDYVKMRKQFGQAIGSFQALKHKITDCYVQIEIARATLAQCLETSMADPMLARKASRALARLSQTALFVTRQAIQFHGAIGFTDEYDVGLYLKRAQFYGAWLGNASVHRQRYLQLQPVEQASAASDREVLPPADQDWDGMSDDDFRAMLRTFFKRHYPDRLRNVQRRLHWDEIKEWTLTLSKQGWLAPSWPKAYGGMGLSPDKVIAFVEEYEGYGVARTMDMGAVMVGPLIIQYGSQAQKQTYLPKILSAEHRWCQGYSEPGAGSDLAALSTQAVLDGDEFVVNGQKIWTTLAHQATHMFTLVRTDKDAKKQAGISFLLIDLNTPGITVRPIRDIAGTVEFCEVFLQDVRVPASNLVGQMNQGWSMAKALLGFERIFLGSPKQGRYALSQLKQLALKFDLFENPVFAAQYADLLLRVDDLAAAYGVFAEIVKRNEPMPPSVSLLKIWATETYQAICVQLNEWANELSAFDEAYFEDMPSLAPSAILYNAIPATIYGGSSQIQREIIARNVLDIS